MLLSELCPSAVRRLAGCRASTLHRVRAGLIPATSPFSSAPLSQTTDDADEPRDPTDHLRRPDTAYVEPSHTRPVFLERFLRRELGLSWARAEREVARCRHLVSAGVPLMAENLAFLTDRGVERRHLQDDVDVLGIAHSE